MLSRLWHLLLVDKPTEGKNLVASTAKVVMKTVRPVLELAGSVQEKRLLQRVALHRVSHVLRAGLAACRTALYQGVVDLVAVAVGMKIPPAVVAALVAVLDLLPMPVEEVEVFAMVSTRKIAANAKCESTLFQWSSEN